MWVVGKFTCARRKVVAGSCGIRCRCLVRGSTVIPLAVRADAGGRKDLAGNVYSP